MARKGCISLRLIDCFCCLFLQLILHESVFLFTRLDTRQTNRTSSSSIHSLQRSVLKQQTYPHFSRPTTNPSWRRPRSWTGCAWSPSRWCGCLSCTAWPLQRPPSTKPSVTSARSVPSQDSGLCTSSTIQMFVHIVLSGRDRRMCQTVLVESNQTK